MINGNGHLTLNNLRLSKFNTVFMNALGNLVCNNCVFTDNAIDYGIFYKGDFGGVLRSYAASTKFVNCTFSGSSVCSFVYFDCYKKRFYSIK